MTRRDGGSPRSCGTRSEDNSRNRCRRRLHLLLYPDLTVGINGAEVQKSGHYRPKAETALERPDSTRWSHPGKPGSVDSAKQIERIRRDRITLFHQICVVFRIENLSGDPQNPWPGRRRKRGGSAAQTAAKAPIAEPGPQGRHDRPDGRRCRPTAGHRTTGRNLDICTRRERSCPGAGIAMHPRETAVVIL